MSRTGYIYKLVCNDVEIKECYVGSTTNMKVRKWDHKHRCSDKNNTTYNIYLYQFIRENGNFENWDMIQIEEFEFHTRHELNARERYHIEQLQATLNSYIPTRTKTEWYVDNKEYTSEKHKKYYNDLLEYYYVNKEFKDDFKDNYKEKNGKLIKKDPIYKNEYMTKEEKKDFQELIKYFNIEGEKQPKLKYTAYKIIYDYKKNQQTEKSNTSVFIE